MQDLEFTLILFIFTGTLVPLHEIVAYLAHGQKMHDQTSDVVSAGLVSPNSYLLLIIETPFSLACFSSTLQPMLHLFPHHTLTMPPLPLFLVPPSLFQPSVPVFSCFCPSFLRTQVQLVHAFCLLVQNAHYSVLTA